MTTEEMLKLAHSALADSERATPEPWILSRTIGVETTQIGGDGIVYGGYVWWPDFEADISSVQRDAYLERDGRWIVSARTREPLLARAVLSLTAENERLTEDLERANDSLADRLHRIANLEQMLVAAVDALEPK